MIFDYFLLTEVLKNCLTMSNVDHIINYSLLATAALYIDTTRWSERSASPSSLRIYPGFTDKA